MARLASISALRLSDISEVLNQGRETKVLGLIAAEIPESLHALDSIDAIVGRLDGILSQ